MWCVPSRLSMPLSTQCFPDRAASRDLSVLIVRCPNNCLWEGQYQEYSAHYRVCPRQPQRCPHPSCMMTLPPDEMEQHVINCRYRPVQCRYCHQEFLSEEVEVRMMGRGGEYELSSNDCVHELKLCLYIVVVSSFGYFPRGSTYTCLFMVILCSII